MIWEELKLPLILTDLDAKTSDDVFEQFGQCFINEGLAKPTYVQGLKEREVEAPTGLDIDGFGIAIPHTPVVHVNADATGIALLKNPVTFTQMGTDDETCEARIIFMLCVANPDAHMDKLQRIFAMIADKAFLQKLTECTTKEEIIDCVKEKESTL